MELEIEKLNKEQKKAVTYGKGPLLIVAGAGTGKTTVITKRLAWLIEQGRAEPEEILALTFTDKAAGEMEERVNRLVSDSYLDLWVMTFHAFSHRVLIEKGLDIGLPTNFDLLDETDAWLLVRQNLSRFKLEYYKPLGRPTKFIHALVSHFSRCKDQGVTPQGYLAYAQKIEDKEERKRRLEIADAYKTYQNLLLENEVLDFGDLINYTVKLFQDRKNILNNYRERFKYILVDEFQDTNRAQYDLMKILAAPENNLTVTSDDDQCLPGNSLVATPKGKKKIREIKKEEKVLTAVGRGHIGVSKVNKVFKRKKKAKLLTFTTKKGFKITVTDNHKMFCHLPALPEKKYYYVYLMKKNKTGWRIGITNNLLVRLRLERSADKILALKAFESKTEAQYYEALWSLRYGIPTVCFKSREGVAIKDELLNRLYNKLDVEARANKLAEELNVDLSSHHFCLDGVNRGGSVRIKIKLEMCYGKHRSKHHVKEGKELILNPKIEHKLIVQTSHRETLKKLEKNGFKLSKVKGGKAIKLYSNDLLKLGKIAKRLERITGGTIEPGFRVGVIHQKNSGRSRSYKANIIPAKNLVLGCFVPIKSENEIVYDEITKIEEEEKELETYDLEIDKTHNFIADGIAVHNSIYKFRGASFGNIVQFRKDYPESEMISITTNYRSCQNILDFSYKLIQNNNPNRLEAREKIDKKLKAHKDGKAEIEHLHYQTLEGEVQGVGKKISELSKQEKEFSFSDCAVLVRTNNAALAFCRGFERMGIPHRFLALRGLYFKPVIMDTTSYFKLLDNYHESLALFRVLRMPVFNFEPDTIFKLTRLAQKKSISLFEACKKSGAQGFSKKEKEELNKLLALIRKHTQLAKKRNVSEIYVSFLEESGYLDYLTREKDIEAIKYVNEFYSKIKAFERANRSSTLNSFMEQIEMELDSGEEGKINFDPFEEENKVKILTVHKAKGLEFKYVFLVNLVKLRFPTIDRKEPIELPDQLIRDIVPQGDVHLEEERRLFYVGMTRAKQGLYFTSALDYGGVRKKKPSRFLKELGLVGKDTRPLQETVSVTSAPKPDIGKEKETLKLPAYFSFSQFQAFKNCPLQYKFAHIYKIPVRGKAVFSFGKTMHNTLERFIREGEEKELGFQELLQIYKQEWIEDWFDSREEKEKYFEQGKKSLEIFLKDFQKKNPQVLKINQEPALEKNFHLKIEKETIFGKIDRIDEIEGGVELIDYKTGRVKDKLSRDDKEQLLIYQIATQEALGLNPKKLTYYYLNDGSQLSFLGGDKEIENIKEKIKKLTENIKKKRFDPDPGWQCKFCDFRKICEYAEL